MSKRQDRPSGIVITGASTGIGEACALELDRLGYQVFAGVRSDADAKRLQERASEKLTPVMIDVTDVDMIAAAADLVREATGEAGLAGLVNNAGIVVSGPLEILPLEKFRWQLEVNVVGQLAVTQAFLPLLRIGKGRLVNMGSVSGKLAPPYLAPYAASKFALEALTDALRSELRHWAIEVSIIEPASVVTPIWEKSRAAADKAAEEVPPEALELYRADLDAMRKATQRLGENGMPVEKVVRAVVHALSARRPKTRYRVGLQTWLAAWSARWVPARLRDRFVQRELGLR